MFPRVRIWILLFAAALLTGSAMAQIPLLGGQGQADSVPETLASPRAAVRTFLIGMNDADMGSAVSALDLSAVPQIERAQRGPQLAFRLWAIMNRQVFVELDKISNEPDADPYILPITSAKGKEVGKLIVDKGTDGAYRFTPGTLADLERIWDVVKDKPVLKGLADPSQKEFDPAAWLESKMGGDSKATFLGLPRWKWVFLLLIVLIGALGGWIVRILSQFIARIILKLKKTDEAYKEISRGGFALSLVIFGALWAGNIAYLGFPGYFSGIIGFLGRLLEIVGYVLLAFAIWDGIVLLYARRASDKSANAEGLVAPVISRLGKAVIIVFAALAAFAFLGYNVTGFLATLGIGGLVLAFAAKDSVENLFGSVMVLVERPFKIGDWIRIGEVSGEVEDIRLRSTRIRTFEDSVIILPNSTLVTNGVENYGMRRFRRFKTTLSITYDTPMEKVKAFTKRIREMMEENPHVWDNKRLVYFNDLGPSSLDILLYCFLLAPTWLDELEYRDELLTSIMNIAQEMGVEFAFPTRTVYLKADGSEPSLPQAKKSAKASVQSADSEQP